MIPYARQHISNQDINFEKKILKDRKFVLSSIEEEKHEKFIKKIKNPMWNEYK